MREPVSRRLQRLPMGSVRGIAVLIVLIVVAFVLGSLRSRAPEPPDEGVAQSQGTGADTRAASGEAATIWTCSMHPQIRLLQPGRCPICGMDLIPVRRSGTNEPGPRQIRMSTEARALARINTTAAVRAFAERSVRMYGRVAYDETKLAYITAWVPGRLDRLYADYTGVTVKKGDHLVDMYSPELIAAQEELIQAQAAVSRLGSSSNEALRSTARSTLEAAREKLRLFGLTAQQIEEAEKTGKSSERLTIYAPTGGVVVHKDAREGMYVTTGSRIYTIADLSALWVMFEAYESDLPWIHYGQRVQFTSQSFPGETFEAIISFIDPLVDPKTRTVNVRGVVTNPGGKLKPDMFVTGTLSSRLDADGHIIDVALANKWICPMHPEVVHDKPGTCEKCGMTLVASSKLGFVPAGGQSSDEAPILIPVSAPLVTGRRAVVYVELPGGDDGPVFEGREVELGPRAGDFYVVRSGIAEGEMVVTNGAFKIDSELQIQAKPSMMSPGGIAVSGGGSSGGAPATAPGAGAGSEAGRETAAVAIEEPNAAGIRLALEAVYTPYFRVQMALAHDDTTAARKAADELVAALPTVDMSLFSAPGHQRWMSLAATIRREAGRIADAGTSIAAARDAFYPLSNAMIDLEKSFGHSGDATHYTIFCPMARDGEGAFWLQDVERVWNAYWGSRMLRCGSVKDRFAPAARGSASHDSH